MTDMNDFHFIRPYFFLLIIPLVIFVYLLIRSKRHVNIWHKICDKDLMPYILESKSKRNSLSYFLIFTTLLLLITAMAGPTWQKISQPLVKSQSGLVIVLDLSPSMNAEDIKPSRLQRAIYKISDILNMRQEGQTALIVFSGDPFIVTPLTDDITTIKALLPALETKIMPSTGHRVNLAIVKAAELLTQAGVSNGSVLLITSELSKKDLEKSIEMAAQEKVKVSVLGIGTESATPIPHQDGGLLKDKKGTVVTTVLAKNNLNQLARSTNGIYMTLSSDDSDIKALTKELSAGLDDANRETTELKQNKWHDQGYLLVLAALPFAALIFRRGLLTIIVLILPQMLPAFSSDNLWKTPDQQAEQLFHQEEYQQAKEKFQNPDWQAAANYKLGEYETAAQLYKEQQTADGYFNSGNAKAKLGDFKGAIETYDKALEMQPTHEDALYNKQVVKDALKQQQEQQKENSDQKNQKDQKDKKTEQNKDQQKDQDQGQDKDQGEDQDKDQDDSKEPGQDDAKDQKQEQNQEKNSDPKDQADDQKVSETMDEQQKHELKDQHKDKIDKEIQANEKQPQNNQLTQEEETSQTNPQREVDDIWLQRIKDDPCGLLRRKFLQQYQQQKQPGNGN